MGLFDDLFGDTPKGNYETKDTTTFVETLFGERSFEVEDKRTGETGRGKGDNAKEGKSNAFHHLKEASPHDPNYTPGSKPNSISSGGSGGGWSGGSSGGGGSSTDTGIGGLLGVLGTVIIGGAICGGIFGNSNKPNSPQPKPQMSRYDNSITESVEEPKIEYVEEPKIESVEEPKIESVEKLKPSRTSGLENITEEPKKPVNQPMHRNYSSYNSNDYPTPIIELDSRVIPTFQKFVQSSDIIDMHNGSVAVKLSGSSYYRVGPTDLEELNCIYKRYEQIFQNALSRKNRYMSRKVIENSVIENLRTELKRVIMTCEKIEPDKFAFNLNR